jgi:hypothetical protein
MPTMDWITGATRAIADACGLDVASLELAEGDADVLLDLAGVAAHASGERTNAPLLCHVLGRARAQGASLDALADAVRAYAGRA